MRSKIDLIRDLSNAFGPSGFEDEVAELVLEEMQELNPVKDTLCNVRCVLGDSEKPGVMLDAHLDEVGLIVQAIRPNGTMNFLPLGGWSNTTLPASKMWIKNRDGKKVSALVAAKPVHFMSASEKNNTPDISNMVLDCGSVSEKSTKEDFGIRMAAPVVPAVECEYDKEKGLFLGKAFDCRIGVAAVIETMRRLKEETLDVCVSASFSSQEEVGDRGVRANVRALKPKVAICFEGCPADDTFMEPCLIQAALYKGPMLRHFDRSMITHPKFQRLALDLAEEKQIPVQESVRQGGGTNGGMIHLEDIPCIVIGIPVRYIHSSYGYCTLKDFDASVDLAVELCKTLNAEIINQF